MTIELKIYIPFINIVLDDDNSIEELIKISVLYYDNTVVNNNYIFFFNQPNIGCLK